MNSAPKISRKELISIIETSGFQIDSLELSRNNEVRFYCYWPTNTEWADRIERVKAAFIGTPWMITHVNWYRTDMTFKVIANPWYKADFGKVFGKWASLDRDIRFIFERGLAEIQSRIFYMTAAELEHYLPVIGPDGSGELFPLIYDESNGAWAVFYNDDRLTVEPAGCSPEPRVEIERAVKYDMARYMNLRWYGSKVLAVTKLRDGGFAILSETGPDEDGNTLELNIVDPDVSFWVARTPQPEQNFRPIWRIQEEWATVRIDLEAFPDPESWSSIRASSRVGRHDTPATEVGWYSTYATVAEAERFSACYAWVVSQAKQMEKLNLNIPQPEETENAVV